ncbi:MAG: iron-containing alcohol dehydrogenase [Xanthomonadales bacterium]|nr:iron-containing alcohol dehydrogenase [Xanthomonadales bacterium]
MKTEFNIQNSKFVAEATPDIAMGFQVVSCPRPYRVIFPSGNSPAENLAKEVRAHKAPLMLVDSRIQELYFGATPELTAAPTFSVVAREEAKDISTVLKVVDFLEQNAATKAAMLFVVGGGIVQDLGAFSGAMYKRGLPWTLVPTTLLAQGDSCVGGKTALNYKKTKNLLALFSAPRNVIIDTGFLTTLPRDDMLSGAGEIFRLCITGGPAFLDVFVNLLPAFLSGDHEATRKLIATSLSAKRVVVEFDEFELDIRRSMNYGHSIGHALEALTNYRIPHGVGVTIGILVENEIAHRRGMFARSERDRILALGRQILPEASRQVFASTSFDGVLDLLRRDKKTEGTVLKLSTLERIGQMRFIDFVLNAEGEKELRAAVAAVVAEI